MKHSEPVRSAVSRSQTTPRSGVKAPAGQRASLRSVPSAVPSAVPPAVPPGPRGASLASGAAQVPGEAASPAPGAASGKSAKARPAGFHAPRRSLSLLALVATTFFVVSGGPYGLEEIVASHGYGQSLLLLLLVPAIWSLPIALLVGELSSSLPQEGGYYAWVRRALGPFWGVQQSWLALAMSLFDMAIYPTLLVTYLGRIWPSIGGTAVGEPGWFMGLLMIGLCALWNIRGSRAVGFGSVLLGVLLLLPFGVLIAFAVAQATHPGVYAQAAALLGAPPPGAAAGVTTFSLLGPGVLVCMWNYMGFDNASTVAAEVERPQRNYPRAMLLTLLLIVLCYALPVLAAATAGMPPSQWTMGSWVEVGQKLGGKGLGWAIAIGGALCGFGMFNVLVMSYSRLPVAMASDGLLPKWLGQRNARSGAPTRAILCAAVLYALCMGLGFRRLVEIDVLLYGASVLLQFSTLIVLRIREPKLARPFRIPGGLVGVVALSALPVGLLGSALWNGRSEPGLWGLSALELGALLIGLGPILYALQRLSAAPAGANPDSLVDPEVEPERLASLLPGAEVGLPSAVSPTSLTRPGHAL